VADKLIFAQAFDGLVRALGPRLDAAVAQRLREAGLDVTRELKPAYPLEVFLKVVQIAGQCLAPGADEETQAFAAGQAFIDGYGQTMVGRAMLAMMRVIGPRRTLERLSRQFRTGNNFSETTLKDLGPQEVELWCNQVTVPGWYRGIISAGLRHVGVSEVSVETASRTDGGAVFKIRWA
jgi:uncharacterized protein (TIGR02265 family)